MSLPPFTSIVASLPETVPFVGPEALERRTGTPTRARLGANESGFGPGPGVRAAIEKAASEVWMYPDPENHELRQIISSRLGVRPNEIAIGEGIDGLMGLAVRLFIAPGDLVVTSLGAYPTLAYHVAGFGGRLEMVPYRGVHEDLEALAATARRSRARMVYLANPDNPMGSHWSAAEVESFMSALPPDCLLMLDEAYGELAPPGTLPAVHPIHDNVLRLRSFSKAYGLAGLRCGYAIGSARVIGAFNRVRNHFGVNRPAQVAARAAWADQAHLSEAVAAIAAARERIALVAHENELSPLPSATNFVTIDCRKDGAFAQRVLEELGRRGVFIRKPMAPGLDQHIRISAGPSAALDVLAEELPQALRAAYEAP